MKLPNGKLALIEEQKVTKYLLNKQHPDNGGKADFFFDLGFSIKAWEILAQAIRLVAINFPVTRSMESSHGKKYIVEGQIETPSGKTPWCERFGLSIAERLLHGW